MKVHQILGCGFLEPVYQEALGIELERGGIPFEKEKQLHLYYDGVQLQKYYQADFVCYDKIILELKAVDKLVPEFTAQVINYLHATKLRLALLINFGGPEFWWKRIVV